MKFQNILELVEGYWQNFMERGRGRYSAHPDVCWTPMREQRMSVSNLKQRLSPRLLMITRGLLKFTQVSSIGGDMEI